MFAWRLTRKAHADKPLDGEGARRYGGRWNHPGTAVVYTSESLSLAVLEYLVNLSIIDLPDDLVSIQFEFSETLSRSEVRVKDLPATWRTYPAVEELKDIGDEWVRLTRTAILVVPSAVIPNERNYVINAAHPESQEIVVIAAEPFALDPRLYTIKTSTRKR
ncbi:MAG TPA: RES domain-containing protein [Pyrinomonadaceae bacterium]|jgi:RES domain-containing protein